MASITKKMVRGHAYYYARECKRVGGKPKIVWQKYLGKLEDIVTALDERREGRPIPQAENESLVTEFGAAAALYDLSHRLDLVTLIDRHVPKRGSGPSVGTYLLAATLNRCLAPRSKARVAEWLDQTVLRRLLDIKSRQLTSQRFWDNMERVSEDAIAAIEAELARRVVEAFDVDLSRVLFDATNYFTFIDTFNERSTLAQRGHSKEGRASLRLVGLALLVSADGHVPLLHHTYPGNQSDAPTFASLTDALIVRLKHLSEEVEHVTVVFDKGNNSEANLDAVDRAPFHFVGSLVPTQHPDLLEIADDRFTSRAPDGLPAVRTYRTTKQVYGAERAVVVAYNENLFVAQSKTLLREIGKRQRGLAEIAGRLGRWRRGEVRGGRPPTYPGTLNAVNAILKGRHMKDLFEVEVRLRDDLPDLAYRFRHDAWEELQRHEGPALYHAASPVSLDRPEGARPCVYLRAGVPAAQPVASRVGPKRLRPLPAPDAGPPRRHPRGGHGLPTRGWPDRAHAAHLTHSYVTPATRPRPGPGSGALHLRLGHTANTV